MRRRSKLAFAALVAGALSVPALAEDGVTATEIVIGSHTALSGPVSAWGIGATEGTRMRFDDANEQQDTEPTPARSKRKGQHDEILPIERT